jgi:hypothetical protein
MPHRGKSTEWEPRQETTDARSSRWATCNVSPWKAGRPWISKPREASNLDEGLYEGVETTDARSGRWCDMQRRTLDIMDKGPEHCGTDTAREKKAKEFTHTECEGLRMQGPEVRFWNGTSKTYRRGLTSTTTGAGPVPVQ